VARTVIVGDVHGCYEELIQLLDVAGVRDQDQLVSVETSSIAGRDRSR
jgi:serine/threonine protein phosphatase 1